MSEALGDRLPDRRPPVRLPLACSLLPLPFSFGVQHVGGDATCRASIRNVVVRSDRPPHQGKPSTRRQPESRETPDDDSGAEIPAVNLTMPIVAVSGFESQEICWASQFVIFVAEPLRLATTQARAQVFTGKEHASRRTDALMLIKLGCLREENSRGP